MQHDVFHSQRKSFSVPEDPGENRSWSVELLRSFFVSLPTKWPWSCRCFLKDYLQKARKLLLIGHLHDDEITTKTKILSFFS